MRKATLEKYRNRLRNLRKNLVGQIHRFEDGKNVFGSHRPDQSSLAESASDVESMEFSAGMLSTRSERLEEINEALERIANGEYGFCLFCQDRLPPARLEVVPHARFCIDCQSSIEDATNAA